MSSSNSAMGPVKGLNRIIAAAAVGSLVEWYDFYLFGSLATVIAARFFPASNSTAALLCTLAIFAAGFLVRPFGASVFNRLQDLTGRKLPATLTTIVMGASTFAIGLLPGYDRIGFAAPLALLILRLVQGLSLGGEYGGAASYVAAHSPENRRGYLTSWLQASGTVGLMLGLAATLVTRNGLDPDNAASVEKFNAWGWRIPFLLSIVFTAVAIYIRQNGKEPETPHRSGSHQIAGRKTLLLAIFGATMGEGVVFFTGQFYTQSFLENKCCIAVDQVKTMLLIAIALASPFFLIFGRWSDRIGRKWMILAGILLAVASYPLLFHDALTISGTAGRKELTDRTEIRNTVSFIGKTRDMLRSDARLTYYEDGMQVTETKKDTVYADGHSSAGKFTAQLRTLPSADYWKIVAILFVMMVCVTITGGPMAAFLAGLFPGSTGDNRSPLAYQIGNGIVGGLTPFIAVLGTTRFADNKLGGLWYPLGVGVICLVIGACWLPAKTLRQES